LVLSHAFWVSRFAANPGVIGQTMILDSQQWTIAGVAQPFRWQRSADVFVPIVFAKEKWGLAMRENHSSTGVVARLKSGVNVEQARTEMKVIAAQLAKEYPGANGGNSATVVPMREFIGGGIRQSALLMFGAVGLLLLVACANVAGLLLARAAVRQREIAVRIALGASRVQLIQQLLTESLLLALGGAVTGIAMAWLSLAGLRTIFPEVENLGGIGVDFRVLGFSLLAAVATALLFGMTPAIQLSRADVTDAIKSGGRSAHGAGIRVTTRKVLVVSQVALAVVLSIGAGLLLRSLLQVLHTDPGLRPERVVVAAIVPPERKDADISVNARIAEAISQRLASLPGVQAVGSINGLPFDNADSWGDFYRTDQPLPEAGKLPNAMQAAATPGYFQAMGIPLLKGRLFLPSDGQMPHLKRDVASIIKYLQSASMVAVINESLARKYWPGEDPIGKSFRFGPPSMNGPVVKIIGVVGDARQLGLDQPVEPQYFFSASQFPIFFDMRLVVRSTEDPSTLGTAIRAAVAEVQPDAAVIKIATMERIIGDTVNGRRNKVLLLGLFSAVTLLLAALGLYATMAYVVAQRTQEIGVRMALGAAAGDVRSMVVLEGGMLAGAGVLIGVAAALAGGRVVSSMLYGVTAADTVTYVVSSVLLIVIMLAASYIPAWRASRLDPMQALRCE
jgi:putative ABC transport system permease protein